MLPEEKEQGNLWQRQFGFTVGNSKWVGQWFVNFIGSHNMLGRQILWSQSRISNSARVLQRKCFGMGIRMNKKKEIRRGIITCLFWLYLLILFRITVFRTGFGVQNLFQKGSINLTLFRDYLPLLKEGHWFRFLYLFLGNILWFIPFGYILSGPEG